MTCKILLINPWQEDVFPPPSLGYLQAVLKTHGAQVCAMDYTQAMRQNPSDFDIVGVSFHSFSVANAVNIREKFKGAHLVCGGHHPSALPDQMLEIGYDQVVIGEGENAIVEILNGSRESIIHGRAVDVNDLPFPDYTGFGGNWSMGIPVISSRGCPFRCSFCASAQFWGRKWKMRDPDNVIAEVQNLGAKTFMFEDDNFTMNTKRAVEICEGLKGKGYSWQCASRAETLQDQDLCTALSQAGCHTAWLGIETLSQQSLDRNHKGTTVEKMLNGIQTAHEAGLQTMSQFIVGLPGDTIKDIETTVQNIKRIKIGRKGTNILWVLPGTEIHEKAKKYGFDDGYYLIYGAPFYTYEHDINTLNHWSNLINTA